MSTASTAGNAGFEGARPCDPVSRAERTFDPSHYQHERYLGSANRSRVLSAYYGVKPLLPRRVQLRLRRLYARRQAARPFPLWPIEPILVERQHEELRRALRDSGADAQPFVAFWPQPHTSACVLTHDVEGPTGIENIERVLEIEQRHGFVSSWNFVAEDYDIPAGTFDRLRDAGCEIGLHGIKHDGKLFQSRRQFESNLPKIHRYMRDWGAEGFRSPATHRRAEWMHELGCSYDSSFPDTDPFEPQAGGCCSIHPFMFGEVVELPITLVQDHTLWEILRRETVEPWLRKSAWIIRNHGLVNVLTHPDYFTKPERFGVYEELLEFLAWVPGCWRTLPCEVAHWWRLRNRAVRERRFDGAIASGGDDDGVWVMRAREDGPRLVLETGEIR